MKKKLKDEQKLKNNKQNLTKTNFKVRETQNLTDERKFNFFQFHLVEDPKIEAIFFLLSKDTKNRLI